MEPKPLDVEILDYPEEIRQSLKCAICCHLLQDAVACPRGHSFCRTCLLKCMETRKHCPVCRVSVNVEDLTVSGLNHLIQNATAKCPNRGEASGVEYECKWTGPYHLFARHSHICVYKQVNCDYCGEVLIREYLPHHLGACAKMVIDCTKCQDAMERGGLSDHKQYHCPEELVSCPLLCGQLVPRKEHPRHMLECAQFRTTCTIPGCGAVVKNMTTHNVENGVVHTNLLLQAMTHAADPLVFTGSLHPVNYITSDYYTLTKSPVFSTGHHEWRIVVLPPTWNFNNTLGVLLNLVSGEPTVVNVRARLRKGPLTSLLEGKVSITRGDLKGWQEAMELDELYRDPVPSPLYVDMIIQYFC